MIECKNVVFKYSTGEEIEKLAIDGLNLEVKKKKKISSYICDHFNFYTFYNLIL